MLLAPSVFAAEPFFNVSTNRSFSPDEKPSIHLYTRNESQLEFRIYHVQDPEKFVAALQQLHSFGEDSTSSPIEKIDEETWLERFHDWKSSWIDSIKEFWRGQLSRPTRAALRTKQSSMAKRSRIVGVAEFAQIPLLNDKQLVARWRQQVPPTFVSDNQILPIDPLPSGLYLVEATDAHLKAYTILLISQTALVTRTVNGSMLAYVVNRKSGEPVAGSQVALSSHRAAAIHKETGSDGVTEFEAPASPSHNPNQPEEENDLWVLATSDHDVALVAPWYSSFTRQVKPNFSSYVYTDRPVYRPGHTVFWKAILRQYKGDVLELPKLASTHVVISDPQDKAIFDKQVPISAMGTLSGQLDLPKDAAVGYFTIRLGDREPDGYLATGDFHVEYYRKPEYQVRLSVAKPRVLQGDSNQATIDSRYFFGEPVANGKVKYRVFQSPHYWWDQDEGDESASETSDQDSGQNYDAVGDQEAEQTGTLNADGKLTISIPTRFVEKQHVDKDYVVEGGVTDEAGREITGKYRFLATYGTYRIHVEPVSYLATKGQIADFRITATDYDDKPVAAKVHLHLVQRSWVFRGPVEENPSGDADCVTGADGTATVSVPMDRAGSITVMASSETREHRTVESETWMWVSGAKEDVSWDESKRVQILSDKKTYAPGDTAHVTLVADVANFHALVTATGYSIEFRRVVTAEGNSVTFDLPISKDSQPNLVVDAVFLQDDQLYQQSKSLKVPPKDEQLQIAVTPVATIFQPGQAAAYDVTARDATGQPVKTELSFGVVDEAIYSVYPDTSGDIVRNLYPERQVYPDVESSVNYYFSGQAGTKSPMLASRARYRPQMAQVKPGNDVKQPKVRKAFPDTAYWQPAIQTDAQGHARVTLNFPDSLTTWRASVRAVTADSKAGSMVNRVIVRKNLIVRMGQPRFLRKGDAVSVPVIVHNYLKEAKQVTLSLEATGVEIASGGTRQVMVSAGGEASAIWKLHADAVGTATLTAKALTNEESDALEVSLPVNPAGVRQVLNSSGTVSGTNEQSFSVSYPAGTDPAAHTLNVDVSPSIAGTVFHALDYLTAFPYGCTEQTMSSFLPNIIVAHAMQQLHLQGQIDQALLNEKIGAGLARLKDYQHADGGWGWWKEDQSQVFMTAYVVSGLGQAYAAGYKDAWVMMSNGEDYLLEVQQHHSRMVPELRAYVAYALAQTGRTLDRADYNSLWDRRNDLSAQALAYTGLAMLKANDSRAGEIGKLLESKAHVDGQFASWPASGSPLLDIEQDASTQSTAMVLKLLVHTDPQSPLVVKAAQWLVANRNQGYWWDSTEQTAFVIFGLSDYLSVSNELAGDSEAEVFVNGVSVGRRHFTQADVLNGDSLHIAVEAAHLQPQRNAVRVIFRGAHGYWSAEGDYYSTDPKSYQKGSISLNVARDYFRLVQRNTGGDITYRLEPLQGPVEQGDVLAVHIAVTGSEQKYFMLEDPIPAGAEFVEHEESYNIVGRPGVWEYWYTRREFRDDHAAIFADDFNKREESFYLLKVVNPGSFNISPARVQAMYQPEVQATTDQLHLDVREVR